MRDAILLGLAQACALMPGVSRSGATISMGLFLGYERAGRHPLRVPAGDPRRLGAGIYKLKDIPAGATPTARSRRSSATVVSFVVGSPSIHWLLQYVSPSRTRRS